MGKDKAENAQKTQLPSERYNAIMNIVRMTATICGCNFLVPNYRYTIMTYLAIFLASAFIALTLYTIAVALLEHEWISAMHALCYSGIGIQGSTKLVNALSHFRLVQWLYAELNQVFATYERQDGQYAHYLNVSLSQTRKIIMTLLAIYMTSTLLMLMVPIAHALYSGTPIQFMHYILPFLDQSTQFGRNLLRVVHASSIVVGMFGNFTSDAFFVLIVCKIPMLKNVMQCKLDGLDDLVAQFPGRTAKTTPMLKDILAFHQKYIFISKEIKQMYFWVIFIQIGCAFLCIISTIICMFVGSFPIGAIVVSFSFITMFSYCSLGNLVELANDSAIAMIYNVKWYELAVPEQKMILLMLRQSQQIPGMSIGGVMDLTMNAGVQVTKTIYSMTMLLNNFLNNSEA